jgi:hypothetical protein
MAKISVQPCKTELQKSTEALDKLFQMYVKKRDGGCIITGGKRNLSICYLFSKEQYPHLRYDEDNVFVCLKRMKTEYHKHDPFILIEEYKRVKGAYTLEALKERAYGRRYTYTLSDIMEMTTKYHKEISK